jgi:anti-sigma factor (TIGR02949 family)
VTADELCDWCEEVLQPYLDRELTADERKEAEAHLADCTYCRKRYKFEDGLRRLVRSAVIEPMEPALKARLANLRLEL